MVVNTRLRRELIEGTGGRPLKTDLRKRIRERVDVCDVPECWKLEEGDKGVLHLDRRYFDDGKGGRYVTIRQVLFQLTYHQLPPLNSIIKTKCVRKENRLQCCNPAHFKIAHWKPPYDDMSRLVHDLKWITEQEALQIHASERTYAAWYLRQLEQPIASRPASFDVKA